MKPICYFAVVYGFLLVYILHGWMLVLAAMALSTCCDNHRRRHR